MPRYIQFVCGMFSHMVPKILTEKSYILPVLILLSLSFPLNKAFSQHKITTRNAVVPILLNEVQQVNNVSTIIELLADQSLRIEGYTIKEILDQRSEAKLSDNHSTPVFMNLITMINKPPGYIIKAAALKGGLIQALKKFSLQAASKKSDMLILIRVKQCFISENLESANLVKAKMVFDLEYDRVIDADTLLLTTYKSSGGYLRSLGQQGEIEPSFRKLISNAFKFFNGWLKGASLKNPKLAQHVSIKILKSESIAPDTLDYSRKRPLVWADFQEPPPVKSKYAAEIFPLFSFTEHVKVSKGEIFVQLAIRAALARSNCWVKPENKTDEALNHEQRHFDILEISRLNFIRRLLAHNYPIVNFDGEINAIYLNAYHELGLEEDLYDKETNHGQFISEQERWNRKIDLELKVFESQL